MIFYPPSHKFTKWVIAMNLHSHEMPINFAQSLVFIFFLLFYFSFVCHWGQLFSFSFISNLGERRKIAENAEKKSCLAKLSDLFLFLFWHKASVDPTRTKKNEWDTFNFDGKQKKGILMEITWKDFFKFKNKKSKGTDFILYDKFVGFEPSNSRSYFINFHFILEFIWFL